MYRNVILEFITMNQQTLLNNNFSQMTLVLFPSEYTNLSKIFNSNLQTKIYHVKNQYTFYKECPFEKLQNSIIEMVFDANDSICVNYQDITFSINDPYYLKDIKNLNFSSLEIKPITENNHLVAAIIIYANKQNAKFNISNKVLLSLVKKIYEDEEQNFINVINNDIINNENWFYVIKKQNWYYINDTLSKAHHFYQKVIDDKHQDTIRLKKILSVMKMIEKDDYQIYYLSKNLFNQIDKVEIYLLDSINNHHFEEPFSLIYTKNLTEHKEIFEVSKTFKEALKKIYPESIIKIYQVTTDSIGVLINKNINKKEQNELKYLLKKTYFLLINKTNGLTKGIDLKKLLLYLENELPNSFNYEEYQQYLYKKQQEFLQCDQSFSCYNKEMIKADTLQTIGKMVNAPLNNYYNLAIYKLHEEELINLLEKIQKNDYKNPIISMCIMSFSKRKIFEALKKIIIKYPLAKIIFHAPKIINHNPEQMYRNILKAKELGFSVIVDSTIYLDFSYNICVKPSDAIIVRQNEYENALTQHNLLNKKIFEFIYQQGKVVIFEQMPKEEDLCIINELTCIIIDE